MQKSTQGSSNIKRGAVEWWRIYNEPNIFIIKKIFTIYYTHVLNIQKWDTLHKYLNGFEVFFMQHKTKINGGIIVQH